MDSFIHSKFNQFFFLFLTKNLMDFVFSFFWRIRVEDWASQFGDELNWLAKNMTKADEIKKVSEHFIL